MYQLSEQKARELFNLDQLLPRVRRPARYVGGEWNIIKKRPEEISLRVALAFPDIYEVGMSYLGFKLFYWLLNGIPWLAAERVYTPWLDMEQELREAGLPLATLESGTPLKQCDIVAFTLPHELTCTNILTMLDLAGIPLKAADRGEEDPVVLAGGYGAFNPEPLADFFDVFFIGEGEEGLPELCRLLDDMKKQGLSRPGKLKRFAGVQGVYVPSLYEPQYTDSGQIDQLRPLEDGVPSVIKRRVIADLESAFHNRSDLVPFMGTVHDRAVVEIMRGCSRGCRFCNAGMLFRPARERTAETVCSLAMDILERTGYEELALCSLSTTDHSGLVNMVDLLNENLDSAPTSLSLPSLRVGSFSVDLARKMGRGRRTGLTFAPEAGSQRLRNVINKNVTEDDLIDTVTRIADEGWKRVKLYFMVGLPQEEEEDLVQLVRLVKEVRRAGRKHSIRGFLTSVSVSPFCPKPHTPFQWAAQDDRESLVNKLAYLRKQLSIKGVKVTVGDYDASWLESIISLGDRRIGRAIERAWRKGCRLDNWSECFQPGLWRESFDQEGIDPAFYINREKLPEEVFPWHHIDAGVTREYLWEEYRRSLVGETTPDCRLTRCTGCGACRT